MHCTSEYCHYDSNTYIPEQIFEQMYFASQFEWMSPFSRYLVISQYYYFVYRDKVFTNTAHP